MPLHRIYTAKGVFSPQEKAAIAENITKVPADTLCSSFKSL